MRLRVRSLASLSGLRVPRGCGSGVGGSCSSDWTPSLATSYATGAALKSQKEKQKKKQKKKKDDDCQGLAEGDRELVSWGQLQSEGDKKSSGSRRHGRKAAERHL